MRMNKEFLEAHGYFWQGEEYIEDQSTAICDGCAEKLEKGSQIGQGSRWFCLDCVQIKILEMVDERESNLTKGAK